MNCEVIAKSIATAYQPPPDGGRPSRIADASALQILLSELEDGTHPDPAAELAGIAPNSIRNWIKRGEAGEEPYETFMRAYKRAIASIEARVTKNVIKASEDPRFWAAGATYLERKHADRWGRRSEPASAQMQIQIGVQATDLKGLVVQVIQGQQPETLSPDTFAPNALIQGAGSD